MILDEIRYCRREIWTPAKKPAQKPAGETTRHERIVVAAKAPKPGS